MVGSRILYLATQPLCLSPSLLLQQLRECVCVCACVPNYGSLHSSSIGRQLRIKHLKLGAYCEKCKLYISRVRHRQSKPKLLLSHSLFIFSLSLTLRLSSYLSIFRTLFLCLSLHCLLLFLFVMHFARKLKIISILLCENNGAANDVHLYAFISCICCRLCCPCVCMCVRVCMWGS